MKPRETWAFCFWTIDFNLTLPTWMFPMAPPTRHHYAPPVQREPHFHFFGVPVHVEPLHFVIAGLFGWMRHRGAPPAAGLMVAVSIYVFMQVLGVLLHEMGHALVGRRFGLEPFVSLSGWGGLTSWRSGRALTPGQSILVSFAGPAVGLALGGGALLWARNSPLVLPELVELALSDFIWVNLGWAIFNLLPVFPLDGGQIMKAVFDKLLGVRGIRGTHVISMFVGGAIVALGVASFNFLLAVMFGQLVFLNWQLFGMAGQWLQKSKSRVVVTPVGGRAPSLDDELQRGWQALEEGRPLMVRMIGESLLLRAETDAQRFEVIHLLAWGRLLSGDARAAKNALALLPASKLPDALLEGAVKLELGENELALPLLVEGIRGRSDDFVASRLAKAVALTGQTQQVLTLLEQETAAKEVGARPFQLIVADLFEAKKYSAANDVGQLLFVRFGQANDAFNVACSLGKMNRLEEGLTWLEKALDAGLTDPKVIDTDADIAVLRSLPEFEALRAKAGISS